MKPEGEGYQQMMKILFAAHQQPDENTILTTDY